MSQEFSEAPPEVRGVGQQIPVPDVSHRHDAKVGPDEYAALLSDESLVRADGRRVLIEPAGFELTTSGFLTGYRAAAEEDLFFVREHTYEAAQRLQEHIRDKRVLAVPGYSTNTFILGHAGAAEVVGADIDANSIRWMSAIRDYYQYRHAGDILMSMAHYPTMAALSEWRKKWGDPALDRQTEDRPPAEPVIARVRQAIKDGAAPQPFDRVSFVQGGLGTIPEAMAGVGRLRDIYQGKPRFDCVYVPFLLGLKDGITHNQGVVEAFDDIWQMLGPDGVVVVAPFSGTEPYIAKVHGANKGKIIQGMKDTVPKDKFTLEDVIDIQSTAIGILRARK